MLILCFVCSFSQRQSPEEIRRDPLTEKVDVYRMGIIMYEILTRVTAFDGYSLTEAKELILRGAHPPLPEQLIGMTDAFDRALLDAMQMCLVFDPNERPNARFVAEFLESKLHINETAADVLLDF